MTSEVTDAEDALAAILWDEPDLIGVVYVEEVVLIHGRVGWN